MATRTKRQRTEIPLDENTAAALAQLETSANSTSRAHGILAREIERLRGKLEDVSAELAETEQARAEGDRQWRERYDRDCATRDAEIGRLKDKLAKVQATLA